MKGRCWIVSRNSRRWLRPPPRVAGSPRHYTRLIRGQQSNRLLRTVKQVVPKSLHGCLWRQHAARGEVRTRITRHTSDQVSATTPAPQTVALLSWTEDECARISATDENSTCNRLEGWCKAVGQSRDRSPKKKEKREKRKSLQASRLRFEENVALVVLICLLIRS